MTYNLTKEAIKEILNEIGLNVQSITGLDPSERTYRRLFWRDNMENYTVTKWTAGFPTGTVVSYVNNLPIEGGAFEGNYVLSVQHPTNTHCECRIRFGCFKLQKTAFEMKWYLRSGLEAGGYISQLRCESNASDTLNGMIRWNRNREDGTQGWEYRGKEGVFLSIPHATEYIRDNTWNYVKITIDWENGIFYRLITNLLDIDLSELHLRTITDVIGYSSIVLCFDITPGTTLPYASYVDDTRLYLNEV